MVNSASRTWIVSGVWLATLTAVISSSVALDATLSTSVFLLVLGLAPAVITLILAAGTPPPTVAEILHAAHAKDHR